MRPRQKMGAGTAGHLYGKAVAEATELFLSMAPKLGIDREKLQLDRKECFTILPTIKVPELSMHDVYLFDYRREDIRCCRLYKEKRTTPQLISLAGSAPDECGQPGREFSWHSKGLLPRTYCLVGVPTGDGFDGDWMKQSVAFLCRGQESVCREESVLKGPATPPCAVNSRKTGIMYIWVTMR